MRYITQKWIVLSLLVLLLAPVSAWAQEQPDPLMDAIAMLREAMLQNDPEGMAAARAALERVHQNGDETGWAAYYQGLSSYRLASTTPDEKIQLQHLDQSIKALEELVKKDDSHAEAAILLSGAYGWKAGLKPMRSMFLGPKANQYGAKAKELAPDNPRVVMLTAVSAFNTPPMFGGDKEAALEQFIQSAELFASHEPASSLHPAWGHDDTYAWMGQAQAAQNNFQAAKEAYQEALAINPKNEWVKRVLLPAVEAKMAHSN